MSINNETPLAVTNSTITANTSGVGAIITVDGGGVTLVYDTITDNVAVPVADVSVDSSPVLRWSVGGDRGRRRRCGRDPPG